MFEPNGPGIRIHHVHRLLLLTLRTLVAREHQCMAGGIHLWVPRKCVESSARLIDNTEVSQPQQTERLVKALPLHVCVHTRTVVAKAAGRCLRGWSTRSI